MSHKAPKLRGLKGMSCHRPVLSDYGCTGVVMRPLWRQDLAANYEEGAGNQGSPFWHFPVAHAAPVTLGCLFKTWGSDWPKSSELTDLLVVRSQAEGSPVELWTLQVPGGRPRAQRRWDKRAEDLDGPRLLHLETSGAAIDTNYGEQPFRIDHVSMWQLSKGDCLRIKHLDISPEAIPGLLPPARYLFEGRQKSKARNKMLVH